MLEIQNCRLDIDVPLAFFAPVPPPPIATAAKWWAVRVDPGGHFGVIMGPFDAATSAELEACTLRDHASENQLQLCIFGYASGELGILSVDSVRPVL